MSGLDEAVRMAKYASEEDCHPYTECMSPDVGCMELMRRALREFLDAVSDHHHEGTPCGCATAKTGARPTRCNNPCPPTFGGHWRDWHMGHGCDVDARLAHPAPDAVRKAAGELRRTIAAFREGVAGISLVVEVAEDFLAALDAAKGGER